MFSKRFLFYTILLISIFWGFNVNAQLLSSDISITSIPKNPQTNQEVKLSVSSYVFNLDQAQIIWSINTEIVASGIGKKEYFFTTSSRIPQYNVEVLVQTTTGAVLNKKITLNINGLDLLWEASNTYSPPFYKGKTLMPHEGSVKMVAIPNSGSLINYSYKWKLDGNNKPNSSGFGKNFYIFQNSYLEKNNEIEVSATDLFGNTVGNNKLSLNTVNPKILFYRKDENLGTLWEKSLENDFILSSRGEILVIEPYFLSNKNFASSDLDFKWFINGEEIETPEPKNILAIKQDPADYGTAEIKVVINNLRTFFQKTEKKLNVNF